MYFKYHTFFDSHTAIKLRAVFQDPTDVTGFDEDSDEYPCSYDMLEYIKNAIFKEDMRVILATKSDEINDASGEING